MYVLTLRPGPGYRLGTPSVATVTVRDDDAPPSVSIAGADAVTEGGTLAFPVTLSSPYNAAIAVAYTLGGTATAVDDYVDSGSGTVTIAKGDTEGTISLATVDDSLDESGERVEVTLATGANYDLGTPAGATGRILDDDGTPDVTVVADAPEVAEGEAVVFTLARVDGAMSEALEVAFTIGDPDGVLAPGAPASVTIGAGDAAATLRLATRNNDVDAPDSEVTLTLRAGAAYGLGTPSAATVTVRDDEAAPAVSVADAEAVPGGGTLAFPVTLSHPSDAVILVNYSLGGTAAAGVDYGGATSGTVTFTPGVTEQQIRLVTMDDGVDGADKAVEVTLVAPDPDLATLGAASSATGTIRDGALPVVTVAADASTVSEGSDAAFTLTRTAGDLSAELVVTVAVTDAASVLEETATSVTFRAGSPTAALRLGTQNDDVHEADAPVTLALVAGAAYGLGMPSSATVTVRNDDAPPTVSIAVAAANAAATEGDTLGFTVTLSRPSAVAIAVSYTVTDRTTIDGARAGADYLGPASGFVTFAPGDTRERISIETVDDDADEPLESFDVTLLPPAAHLATLGAASAVRGEIRDNDLQVVTVAARTDAVGEWSTAGDRGTESKEMFVLTRTRGDELSQPLTVTFAVGDADGVLATSPLPTTVTFGAGEADRTVELATDDDEVEEANAAVTLTLTGGATWRRGDPHRASVTVWDDDGSLPEVFVADAGSVTEGGALVFPVSLSDSFDAPVTVGYTLSGAAAAGEDHDGAAGGTLVFAPGETGKTISLRTVDDDADEADETVEVGIFVFHPGRPGQSAPATGLILDNDLPDVTVAASPDAVTEGEAAAFTVTRAGDLSGALSVTVEVTDADGVLATAPLPASVTIGAGDAAATLRLATRDNAVDEPDSEVTLTLKADPAYDLETPSAATVTVEDDERPIVTVAADAAVVREGESVAFTLTRIGLLSDALDVFFTLDDAGGVVTSTVPSLVTFEAGNDTATLSLGTAPDTVAEPDATVTLALRSGADYAPGDPFRASVTVQEDDGGLSRASVADAHPVLEGNTLEFPVRLSNPNAAEVQVTWELSGEATAGVDYEGSASGTLTFAAQDTERTIRLVTVNDRVDEPEETVRVELKTILVGGTPKDQLGFPSSATGRILNNGLPLVTVAADAPAVTEGSDAAFTLTRTGDVAEALDVSFTVTDTDGALASPPPAVARFEANESTALVSLATADDDVDKADADVVLTLLSGEADASWTLGDSSAATVTVRDNDLPVVTVTAESELIVEEGADLAFIITRTEGDLSGLLEVNVLFKQPGQEATEGSNRILSGDSTHRAGGSPAANVDADVTYVLTLRPGPGYRVGTPSVATVTVRDDDVPPAVSIADADAVREGGTLELPVTLSGPYNTAITVAYSLAGTATVVSDYTDSGSGTVTFVAGDTEGTVSLATVDDDIDETAEEVVVTLQAGASYGLGVSEATGRILDNDGLPEVTVAADADSVAEGEAAAFTLTRVGDASAALEVTIAVTDDDSVLAGVAPTRATFRAGSATAALSLATRDDDVDGAEATLTLTLQPDAAYELDAVSAASVTVTDNDAAPAVSIADADTVTEGGTLAFTVSLSHPSDSEIAVDYSLAGTATVEDDYMDSGSGTVTFAAGSMRETISLATVDDATDETAEEVVVTLQAPDPALATPGAPSSATGRILDTDGLPEVTVAAAAGAVTEGGEVVFVLTRVNGDASAALEVTVAVADDDSVLAATAPAEVAFEPEATMATLSLATVDDAVDETDATVTLTLRDGSGYSLGGTQVATVTVEDDDLPVVTVAADADSVAEGEAAAFTLTRVGDASAALEVTVAVTDGGSVLEADAAPASVTFGAGESTFALGLATDDDEADEPDTLVTLALVEGETYDLGEPKQAAVTVQDDDRPVVTTADAGAVTEGETIEFPVRLSGPFDREIRVAYSFGGTASAVDDYTPPASDRMGRAPARDGAPAADGSAASGTLTFLPKETRKTIRLVTVDDDADEAEETVEVSFFVFDPGRPGDPDTAQARILDNDDPVVTVAADAAAVTEGEAAAFTLTRAGDPSETLTVSFEVTGGGAVLDADPPTEATFDAGADTARVTLATDDDGTEEADAVLTLTLTDGDTWDLGDASAATVTVQDDDGAPKVSIADAEPVTEGGTLAFSVTLSNPGSEEIRVSYSLTGSAARGDDYTDGGSGTLTFAPGDVRRVISLATVDDDTSEMEETVVVTLAAPDPATLDRAVATGRIRDNERPVVTVAAVSETITEGADAEFTLMRAGDASRALDVSVSVTDAGSVLAGTAPASVTIEADESRVSVTLSTVNDGVDEADTPVTLTLVAGETYDLGGSARAVVTVQDDDAPPVVSIADAEPVPEGGRLAFPVSLSHPSATPITLSYDLAGSATKGDDYTDAGAGSVTVPAGNTQALIPLMTVDDGADEPNETVDVTLSAPAAGVATLGVPSAASGTIRDDDLPVVAVAGTPDVVAEGEAVTFTLTRTGVVTEELAVTFTVVDADRVLVSNAPAGVTFEADASTALVTLATREDGADKPDVQVTLRLDDGAAWDPDTPSEATVTVQDDDLPLVTAAADADTVDEGEAAVFTLTRVGVLSGELAVTFEVAGGDAVLSDTAPAGVTFEADASTALVTLATVDDGADEADATLTLTLTEGAAYDLGEPSEDTVTVRDDDLPLVSLTPRASYVVAEGENAELVLTREGVLSEALEVGLSYTDPDSALASPPETVTIGAEMSSHTLRLPTRDDAAFESDRSVTVQVRDDSLVYRIGNGDLAFTVRDNDGNPDVTVAADAGRIGEGADAVFTLTRSREGISNALAVNVAVADADGVLVSPAPATADFLAGEPTTTLRLPTREDAVDRNDATLTLTLEPGAAYRLGSQPQATVTVSALQIVTLVVVQDRVAEGEDAVVILTREGDLSGSLDVFGWGNSIDDSDDVVVDPWDLVVGPVATFGAGDSMVTLRVGTRADTRSGDVLVRLTLYDRDPSNANNPQAYVRGNPWTDTFVVLDTDLAPEVSVAGAEAVTEGGTLEFPVTLDRPYDVPVTVAYTLGGTAEAGDYADATGGSVTFAARETEKTIRVTTRGNHIDEADKTVTVTLSPPVDSLATLGASTATATGTIRDDDLPVVTVGAESDTVAVGEDVVVILTRAGEWNRSEELTVTYCLRLNSAEDQCSVQTHDATFKIGESTTKASLSPSSTNDLTLYLTLEPGAAYRLGDPSVTTVAVRDYEDAPEVSVADADAVREGGTLAFPVTLSGPHRDAAITVDYTLGGTATAVDDYTDTDGGSGTVTFGPGEIRKVISLATLDDEAVEGRETVEVTLSLPAESPATLDRAMATGGILDGDGTSEVTVAAAADAVTEGADAVFVLTRVNGDVSADLTVSVAVTDAGSVLAGPAPASVTFGTDELTATLRLGTDDDAAAEADAAVVLTLESGAAYSLGAASTATVTVRDNDTKPAASIAGAAPVTEGGTLEFPVTLSGPFNARIVVAYTLGGAATAGTDYTDGGSGTVTFAPGDTRKPISLVTLDDDADEPDEAVEVTLTAGATHDLGASSNAEGTIRDGDPPVVTVAAVADWVVEGTDAAFTLTREGVLSGELAVSLEVTSGGAVLAGAPPTTATFDAGATTVQVTLATEDDAAAEADATLTLTVKPGGFAYVPGEPSEDTVTVRDNDAMPMVSIAGAGTVTEGGTLEFAVTLSGPYREAITVDYAIGGATAGDDYTDSGAGTLTFAEGAVMQVISLETSDDDADEPDRTVEVTLSLPADSPATLGTATASGTITDDDLPLVTVAADADTVGEGEAAVFTLTRAGVLSGELAVTFEVAGGDAVLSGEAPSGATFGVDASTVLVTLATVDDGADETDATLTLTLTEGAAYDLGEPSEDTVTVRDDDLPLVSLTPRASYVVAEGENAELVLTREGVLSEALEVGLSYTDPDSALASPPETVTIGAEMSSHTLRLPTRDDAAFESDRSVTVQVRDDSSVYRIGNGDLAFTVREDDGSPDVTVAADAGRIGEGADAVFTLTRSREGISNALAVNVTVADADGVLVSPAPATADFLAGEPTTTLRLSTREGTVGRTDATLTLTLEPGAAYRLGSQPQATVTVSALPIVTLVVVQDRVAEGEDAVVILTRSGGLSGSLDVFGWGNSIDEDDVVVDPWDLVRGPVATFGAGDSMVTVRVGTRADTRSGDVLVRLVLNDRDPSNANNPQVYVRGNPWTDTFTVLDTDLAPEVSVADAEAVTEGGTLEFPVTLDRPYDVPVTVAYTLAADTAEAGDYADATGGSVTFAARETEKTIRVATRDDRIDEADKTVTVTLSPPVDSLATLGASTATATGTIRDDDLPVVTVRAESDTITVEEEAVVILTRAGNLSEELTVTYCIGLIRNQCLPNRTHAGTFEIGESTTKISYVTQIADDGTSYVMLRPGAAYRLGDPSEAAVAVRGYKDAPKVSVADADAVREGGTLAFPVTLSGPHRDDAITVSYTLGGTATVVDDYTDGGSGAVTFGPGEIRKVISLATLDDEADEEPETVEVTLSLPAGSPVMLDRAMATGRILDGDGTSEVTVAAAADTVVEGADAVFTLTRVNGDVSQALTVSVAVTDDDAVLAETAPASVTFEVGDASATLRLGTDDDTVVGADATLTLTLTAGDAHVLGTPSAATVTVRDNDGTPTVSIADAGSVAEGGTLAFPVTLSGPFNARIAVPYTLGGAATAGDDYADSGAGAVTFAPGEVRNVILLATMDDGADEPDETVAVTLAAGASWALDPSPEATGTIADNDPPVVAIAAVADAVAEGADAVFTLTRTEGDLSEALEVSFEIEPADGVLASDPPESVTFGVGVATATLRLPTQDDTDVGEADATLTLTLQPADDAAYTLGEPSQVMVTVRDDDAMPEVSVAAAASVTEGGALEFPVTLSGPFNAPIAVEYTLGGAATAGDDYEGPASGTVTFAAGDTRETITLKTLADMVDEPDETVVVTLSPPDPGQATLGASSSAEGTIIDDDLPVVTVAAQADMVEEGGTSDAIFVLTRAGQLSDELTVTFTVTGGDAVLTDAPPAEATFAADGAVVEVSLAIDDDGTDEADATLTLTLDAGADYALGDPSTAAVTVLDDDLPVVTVAADAAAVTEGEDAVFTLTRAGVVSGELMVTVTVTDTDAVLADTPPTSVTFGSGDATAELRLGTADDAVDEVDATLTLTLGADDAYGVGEPSTAAVTVRDDDLPVVTVAADETTVTEGEEAVFTLTREGIVTGQLEVTYAFRVGRDGTFGRAGDEQGAETVTFEAGQSTVQVRPRAPDDDIDSAERTFVLWLVSDAGNRLGNPSRAEITVLDNDAPPEVSISDAPAVTEGGTLEFPVSLSHPSESRITVSWTLGGSATAGADHEGPASGTVTFAARMTRQTISLKTVDDGDDEPEEEVVVTLKAPADPTLATLGAPSEATGRIRDNDGLSVVTIAAERDTVAEGEDAVFTLTRAEGDASLVLEVAVTVTDEDGALATGAPSAVNFGAGQSTATLRLPTRDDNVFGATADIVVTLQQDTGYTLGAPPEATVAVLDNDAPVVTVTAVADTVTEGAAAEFDLTRTGDLSVPLTVTFEVTGGGAVLTSMAPATVTFGATANTARVTLATEDDDTDEANAALTLALADGDAWDPGTPSSATVTVEDNDATPTVSVGRADRVMEGGPLEFPVSLSHPSDAPVTVLYALAGTATAGADYTDSGSGTVTIAAGSRQGTISLTTVADGVDEEDETVQVTLSLPSPDPGKATLGTSTATGTITDDVLPVVTVAAETGTVTEGTEAVFILTRAGDLSGELTVTFEVTGGGAVLTSTAPTTVTFGAAAETVRVTLATENDSADEANAAVTLTLTDVDAYEPGSPSEATVTVEDDDLPLVTAGAETGTVTEGAEAVFILTRAGDLSGELAVTFEVTGGDAVLTGTAPSGATFEADADTVRVALATADDATDEANAVLTLTLADGDAWDLGTSSSATVTVEDNDATPTVSVGDADAVTEGETLEFPVSLSHPSDTPITVLYTLAGTAAVDDDYTDSGSGTVTVAAESTQGTISLETLDDETVEDDETVDVTLSLPSPDPGKATLGTSAATGTIEDNDQPRVTLELDPASIDENGETSTVTASLDRVSSEDTTVTVTVTPVDPAVEGDYTLSANLELTIPAGTTESTGEVTITAVDNAVDAPDKEVTVSATVENTQGVAAPQAVTLTITDDDDTPAVTLVLTPASIGENGETSTVTATLDRASSEATTVTVAVTPVSPAVEGDYTLSANLDLTIPAGETASTGEVTITAVDNDAHAPDKTVTVSATATNTQGFTAPQDVTLTIRDDDDSPATGVVTVTTATTFTEGETLSADTSGLTDEDGLDSASYVWQWIRTPAGGGDSDISGATSQTYTPVFADAGATLKVRVTVTDDEGHEAEFTSAATSAVTALPRPSVTVVSDGDVTEGSPALFTLTRTGDPAQTLDVAWAVTATGDFGVTPGTDTATFEADSATVQVSLTTTGDGTHEAHGSVTVTLTADTGADPAYVLGDPSTATAAVEDDDDSPATGVVTVTTATTFTEGETLSADTSGLTDEDGLDAASYAWQWVRTPSGGSDADISGATSQTYTPVFADAGATLKVRVTVTDDEGHEAEFTSAATSAVTALPRPSVTVASDGDVTEGETVTFTLTRTGDPAEELEVAWTVTATGDFGVTAGGEAMATFLANDSTVLANDSTVQVSVDTTDDEVHEAHGSVTVTLTADTGADPAYVLGDPSTATAAVEDDDDSPATGSVTVTTATTFTEGETLTADTSGLTDGDGLDNAAYVYQWVRTPAGGSDADISGATGATYVPVFADVGATLKVKVTVTDDEGHEATITSAATSAVAALPRPLVTVAAETDTVTEGKDAVFILTRTGAVTDALVVTFAVTGGDAVLSDDPPTEATFGAGATTVRVPLATDADADVEDPDANLTLTLIDGDAYDLGTPSAATVTVTDPSGSDAVKPVVTVAAETGTVTEGTDAVFVLTRTGDTAQTLDVDYEVTASGDFGVTPGAGTATFLANDATVQVSVATTGDGTHEAHGSVTVTLTADTSADPAYVLGDPSAATAAVEDDDDSPATGAVTVTGTPTEGQTLTADTSGITDGDGLDNAAYVYQWVRTPAGGSDADISGATGATYVPVFADVGRNAQGPGDGHRRRGPRGDHHERGDLGGGGAAAALGDGGGGRRRDGGRHCHVHADAHGRHGGHAGRALRGHRHRGLRRDDGREHGDVPGEQRHGAGEPDHDG